MTARLEPGSFRDREGRVFYHDGKVYRALSKTAAEAWREFSGSELFADLSAAGKVVATREVEDPADLLAAVADTGDWQTVLVHERVPFISYPYEWSFTMLKDAALLQLDLLEKALAADMTLKDASAYNIQWVGSRPVFIDVVSFEPWRRGEPWIGYLQFCQLFLYPLLLTAHRDIPFAPWLRGAIDGITPEECSNIFSTWRDRLRPGIFMDVYLQAKLQARHAAETTSTRNELQRIGFRKEMIVNNVRRLKGIVGKLRWRRAASEWAAYDDDNTYDRENREIKESFVREAAASRRWRLAWDLGCNTGAFSRIVAEHADTVVAADADHLAVDRLYRSLKEGGPDNILPLVNNLADSSPALGWRHRERMAFSERTRPDLTLCLALIHHVVITANVPLAEFIEYLAGLGTHLVIEFVTKDDPMVRKLLLNKPDIYHDYEVDVFEARLGGHFNVTRRESYHGGTRCLYFARPHV